MSVRDDSRQVASAIEPEMTHTHTVNYMIARPGEKKKKKKKKKKKEEEEEEEEEEEASCLARAGLSSYHHKNGSPAASMRQPSTGAPRARSYFPSKKSPPAEQAAA